MDLQDKIRILVGMAAGTAISVSLLDPTIRLAFRWGLIDKPDQSRKLHRRTTAYMGGAILWASMAILLLVLAFTGGFTPVLPALAAFSILFGVGILDDAYDLKPRVRLVFQGMAVGILAMDRFLDLQMDPRRAMDLVALGAVIVLGVATVNAFNLIDGLDGLALGAGMLTASPMVLAQWNSGDTIGVAIGLAFVSACAGLIRGNLHPARIFLGDAGSLLIGGVVFALALRLPASGDSIAPPLLSGAAPLLAALPLIDMVVVVVGRFQRGRHPFQGDRTHLHHRLLQAGFDHEGTVGWIHMAMSVVAMAQVGIWILGLDAAWSLATLGLWIPAYAALRSIEHASNRSNEGNLPC